MITQSALEHQFRRFTIKKLQTLEAILDLSAPLTSSETISTATGSTQRKLGGILSSLSRTKIDDEPLLIPIARSEDQGMIWKYNEDIAPKKEAKKVTKKILSEVKPWLLHAQP